MRFGNGRGMRFAALVLGALAIALPAKAGGLFGGTIPREVLAQDYRTGGVYFARRSPTAITPRTITSGASTAPWRVLTG